MSAEEYSKERDETNIVPRILHFTWIFQPIPDKYLSAISEFEQNNPDYEVSHSSILDLLDAQKAHLFVLLETFILTTKINAGFTQNKPFLSLCIWTFNIELYLKDFLLE